jgi:hypothetical protein
MDAIAFALFEIFAHLIAWMLDVIWLKGRRLEIDKSAAEFFMVGVALSFILALASIYFFPIHAIKFQALRIANAIVTPLITGLLIGYVHKIRTSEARIRTRLVTSATIFSLIFMLTRLAFGK